MSWRIGIGRGEEVPAAAEHAVAAVLDQAAGMADRGHVVASHTSRRLFVRRAGGEVILADEHADEDIERCASRTRGCRDRC